MLENDGSVIPHIRREKLRPILLWAATALLCYAYSVLVDFVSDDWYFVLAAGTNLANGHDLAFTPGERVHAFTSPLNTLLTAFLVGISGSDQPTTALWLHRLLSAASLGVAVIIFGGIARRYRFPGWAGALLYFALMLDGRILAAVTGGSSLAFAILFVAVAIRIQVIPHYRPALWLGLSWGGLFLTQPVITPIALTLALSLVIFMPGAAVGINRGAVIRNYFRALVLAALVVTPWLIWARFNFGSALPVSELTEFRSMWAQLKFSAVATQFFTFPLSCLAGATSLDLIFAPTIPLNPEDWPVHAFHLGRLIGLLACFYWLNPFGSRFGRAISLATCLTVFAVDRLIPASDYRTEIPIILLSWLSLAAICSDALKLGIRMGDTSQSRAWSAGVHGLVAMVLCLSLAISSITARGHQARQIFITQGTLNSVGHWLNDNAKPRETVMLPQSGQIGYLSKLDLHDYPGLSSWQVVLQSEQLQTVHGEYRAWSDLETGQIIALGRKLESDWLVLRPRTAIALQLHDSSFLADYEQRVIFTRLEELEQAAFVPGRRQLKRDATRIIYRRRDLTTPSASE